jgi:hypothetical protein
LQQMSTLAEKLNELAVLSPEQFRFLPLTSRE